MKTIFLLLAPFLNNYTESPENIVYVQSYQMVVNDEIKRDIIVGVKPGKKKFTFEVLVVDNDSILVDFHN
jgi:hypothetical protein